MKFLTSIDLIKNELQNAVIQNLATSPSSPKEGQIYYNTNEHTLYQFNGTNWVPVGAEYILPIASKTTLGGIKVGQGLTIKADGTLDVDSVNWSGIEGKPTTLSGYGIVDAKIENGVITLGSDTIIPVVSVNGKTGNKVVLSAEDVGALPDTTTFVLSVNNRSGAVSLSKSDVGLSNVDNVKQYSASNEPPYPVTSVDGAKGDVVLNDVKYTEQTLTDTQKEQARANIGAGTSSFSGNYNDLTNKPTVDTTMSDSSTNAVQNKVIKAYVDAIIGASQGIVYKGVINKPTDIPTTYGVGWLYMIGTEGTYVGQKCEVGDLMIAVVERSGSGNLNSDWDVIQTNIDGAITSISGTAPISVSGTGASRTVEMNTSGVTAQAYGDTSNQAPSFGETFKVPSFTVDKFGRLTVASSHTVTIPSAVASGTTSGLMSSVDYTLLHGLDASVSTLNDEVNTLKQHIVNSASATIEAGGTSVSVNIPSDKAVTSVVFKNATTQETVMADWKHDTTTSTLTATITTPVTYSVIMIYTYM